MQAITCRFPVKKGTKNGKILYRDIALPIYCRIFVFRDAISPVLENIIVP